MLDVTEFGKRGYLIEDFRLFHLRDSRAEELDFHYHEFDKIVFHLSGRVTYHLEGKRYFLKPYDILMVGHSLIHRPVIDPAEPYERRICGPVFGSPKSAESTCAGREGRTVCAIGSSFGG